MARLALLLTICTCLCVQTSCSKSFNLMSYILPNSKSKEKASPNGKTADSSTTANDFQPIDYQLLSGHSPKRTTQCVGQRTCRFQCLGGKCENEEVVLNDETSRVQLQCDKGERACLGHILIRGQKYSKKEDTYYGRKAVIDCDFMNMASCQGSEIKFSDIHTQILNGDVRESDILFQNADQAIINIDDVPAPDMHSMFRDQQGDELRMNHVAQFNMNEVFTRNVNTFELNANADHSAVGSIFDLSGVKKKFTIRCKGTAACDGSLFIFDRCVHRQYEKSIIYCWPDACNDISIWVLHEQHKNTDGKTVKQCQNQAQILYSEPAVMIKVWDDEKERWKETGQAPLRQKKKPNAKQTAETANKIRKNVIRKRNIFILEHRNINEQKTLSQNWNDAPSIFTFGVKLPDMKVVPFVELPPNFQEVFTVLRSGDRKEWWDHIRAEEARVVQHYDEVQDRHIKHGWISEKEGLAFFGAMYASQMSWSLASSSQTCVFWISSNLLHHIVSKAALLAALKPLLPVLVVGTIWNAAYHGILKEDTGRYEMVQSRLHAVDEEEQRNSDLVRSQHSVRSSGKNAGKKGKSVVGQKAGKKTGKAGSVTTSVVSYEWIVDYVILALMVALVICVGFVVGCGGGFLTAHIKQQQTDIEDDMV